MSHQSTIHPDLLDVFQEAFDATSLDFTTVDDVEVQNGRNASAIARFDRAGRVHLKRMEGPEREQRYARTVAFEHWRCGRELHFHAPTLLAHDENHTCVAFGFVDSETNVGHAVANGTADVTLLEQCMAAIGSLHCPPVDPAMDTSLPEYPPQHVGAVGLAYLENATFGELSLWQILQHDRELAAGLARLAAAPFTPTPIAQHTWNTHYPTKKGAVPKDDSFTSLALKAPAPVQWGAVCSKPHKVGVLGSYCQQARRTTELIRLLRAAQESSRQIVDRPLPRQQAVHRAVVALLIEDFKAGASLYELAKHYNLQRNTVRAVLRREGLDTAAGGRPPLLTDAQKTEIREQYAMGVSQSKLANAHGVSVSTIRRALRIDARW